MMSQLLILALALVSLSSPGVQGETTFCYMEPSCGPSSSYWPGACQTGKHQSPIDLPGSAALAMWTKLTDSPKEVSMTGGYSNPDFYVQDNGHTIQVSFTPGLTSSARLSGYGLDGQYELAQLHFHWGQLDLFGSEHAIDGKHFPMEMHMVHYNVKYPSFTAAVAANDPKALAVVARFLIPGMPSPIWAYDPNGPFDTLGQYLPTAFEAQAIEVPKTMNLLPFLPKSGEKFYRYTGSLTTPNCTEDVVWTVFAEPVFVNPAVIAKFRTVRNHEGRLLGENARPIQPWNGRDVEIHYKK